MKTIASNGSCVAGIPALHAIADNCSCVAGVPAIHAIAGNCSCVAGVPAIHGHKKGLDDFRHFDAAQQQAIL